MNRIMSMVLRLNISELHRDCGPLFLNVTSTQCHVEYKRDICEASTELP